MTEKYRPPRQCDIPRYPYQTFIFYLATVFVTKEASRALSSSTGRIGLPRRYNGYPVQDAAHCGILQGLDLDHIGDEHVKVSRRTTKTKPSKRRLHRRVEAFKTLHIAASCLQDLDRDHG